MQLYLNVGSFRWDSRSQMFFKIGVLRNFAIFTGKHLRWSHFHRTRPVAGDILINKLRLNVLTSFVYCTSYELRDIFIARVTSYLLHVSYKLLFIARVTSYFYCTSYKLLFIARVTSYCLLHESRVTFCIRVTSYCLLHKLQVTFLLWVTIKTKMIKLFMITRLW